MYANYHYIVLASAHERSQLTQPPKLGVGGRTEELEVLSYSTISIQALTPHLKIYSCRGTESTSIVAMPMLHRGQPNGGKIHIAMVWRLVINVNYLMTSPINHVRCL